MAKRQTITVNPMLVLTVTDGFLSSLPDGCWAEGPGHRVWLASLVGGKQFDRDFWTRGRAPLYFQVPATLAIGQAIEFGCDTITTATVPSPRSPGGIQLASPERQKRRTYAFVQHRGDGLEIELAKDAQTAIRAGNLFCRRNNHAIHGVSMRDLEDVQAAWGKLTVEQKASFILVTFGGCSYTADGLAGAMADWILENS